MVIVPSFRGMEVGQQQQHAREHSNGSQQRKIYCSHHPIMKMVIMIAPSLTPGRASYWSAADFGTSNV
jgi:hypothetical protein